MTERNWSSPLNLELVEDPQPARPAGQHFRGAGVETIQDEARLDSQYSRILRLMRDGKRRTLAEISAITHDPEGSIIRQLSYIDDPRWNSGFHKRKELRNGIRGLYEYWLESTAQQAEKEARAAFHAQWKGGPNP